MEVKNDNYQKHYFTLFLHEDSELTFIGIEFYNPRMYLSACHYNAVGVLEIFDSDGSLLEGNHSITDTEED